MRTGLILLTAATATLGSVAVATPAAAHDRHYGGGYHNYDRGHHRGYYGGRGYGYRGDYRRDRWHHGRDYRWNSGYHGHHRGYYGRPYRGW